MIDITNLEKWHFGMTEDMANSLLKLVLSGKKRATASSFLGCQSSRFSGRGRRRCFVSFKEGLGLDGFSRLIIKTPLLAVYG